MTTRGCGIIFYHKGKDAVLVFRRDNKSWIPFPNKLDILGGHVEEGEDSKQAISREMAEELIDLRTDQPYELVQPPLFLRYTDARDCEQSIYTCEVNFELADLRLLEGKELIWVTRQEVLKPDFSMAFEFELVLRQFFSQ